MCTHAPQSDSFHFLILEKKQKQPIHVPFIQNLYKLEQDNFKYPINLSIVTYLSLFSISSTPLLINLLVPCSPCQIGRVNLHHFPFATSKDSSARVLSPYRVHRISKSPINIRSLSYIKNHRRQQK